jgi:hypothetical protein
MKPTRTIITIYPRIGPIALRTNKRYLASSLSVPFMALSVEFSKAETKACSPSARAYYLCCRRWVNVSVRVLALVKKI